MSQNLKDHKDIGQEQELFFTNEIAPGAPFWLPKGMVIFKELEKFIRDLTVNAGYLETSTPIMAKSDLFKQSGHWTKFGEHNMYNLQIKDEEESIPKSYTLKPMNCPESTILYRFRNRSYRELPLRFSEIGRLHRREKSGEVNGLLRVRQLTMDDAHIYARDDQMEDEIGNILDNIVTFYKSFGFEYEFKLATRPEERAGNDKDWDKAELTLENVLKHKKQKYSPKDRDGAFYGPKIDLHIKDAQRREWQLATVQLDFYMPSAFGLKYVDEKGEQKTPVMIHRAIFGSFERFIAILTEHYQGSFPLWLSPAQAQILPISDKTLEYAKSVAVKLKKKLIRTEIDTRSETLQSKIRNATIARIPYLLIVGQKEQETNQVAVRTRGGKDLGLFTTSAIAQKISKEIENKG
ncbi:MAG: Threonine-tRNA ligase [Candidatus Curtissbacteria bacterium GW2011_GWA1_40_9]|uniref:Threonine--tRNA ligase n=1 Tax=Candidatus Curtissbacteria bacterium GW2011_GWA1_40_9 TaxID=1618408 RepID=A0A0G0TMQ7_9BACT|nr:MAG: Threonine-tRNA ligase [Candidatus Curtissbacteria bacterium GW2011_GWA1_40_9]